MKLPDLKTGLSSSQAEQIRAKFGTNEFEKPTEHNPGQIFLAQFKSPLIYILVLAGLVTAALGEYFDSLVIMLVVLVNSLLGFWQEFKAARSLEALREYLKPKVTALRQGDQTQVLLKDLVPGDIVLLNSGSSIPADGVLIEAQDLLANESLLTGESRPVAKQVYPKLSQVEQLTQIQGGQPDDKHADNWVYMGTTVAAGIGTMLVVRTGSKTQMGQIAYSLQTTVDEATPIVDPRNWTSGRDSINGQV